MASTPFSRDVFNVPNKISLFRIVLIIICVTFFVCDYPITGSLLGLVAGLSDYADGIYARKHNMCTQLGALLDQVADLLFNFFVMSAAVYMGVWPLWLLFVWGIRDLSVLSMRASAAQQGFDIPSIYWGKLASAIIYYALFIMPIAYALMSGTTHQDWYPFADFTHVYHNSVWFSGSTMEIGGVVLYYVSFVAVLVGVIMQWATAVKYFKTYVTKYNELNAKKAEAADKAADSADKAADSADKAADSADKAAGTADKAADSADKAADSADKAADSADKAADSADKAADNQ